MILVDTSAWVEYDRATGSVVDKRLSALITNGGQLAVTEPIMMELQAGARDDQRQELLRRMLLGFHLLPFDPVVDFDGAAHIYRRCRAAGITPRGMLDCMIASVAWRTTSTLLAQDADLDRVATVVGIPLDQAAGSTSG